MTTRAAIHLAAATAIDCALAALARAGFTRAEIEAALTLALETCSWQGAVPAAESPRIAAGAAFGALLHSMELKGALSGKDETRALHAAAAMRALARGQTAGEFLIEVQGLLDELERELLASAPRPLR